MLQYHSILMYTQYQLHQYTLLLQSQALEHVRVLRGAQVVLCCAVHQTDVKEPGLVDLRIVTPLSLHLL